jgi:hypothetical protein
MVLGGSHIDGRGPCHRRLRPTGDLVLMGAKRSTTFSPVVLVPTARAILEQSQTQAFICNTHTVLPMFIAAERLLEGVIEPIRRIQKNVRPPGS